MPTLHHHGEIDAEAADWAVKADADGLSPAEARRLEAWLAADRRHRGAYARAQAVLRVAGQLHPHDAAAPRRTVNRRLMLAGGGLVAASLAGGVAYLMRHDRGLGLQTGAGETRRVALGDGSIAVLDSHSRLRAAVTPEARQLVLATGEAWLSAAEDAARPFAVHAGPLRAQAVAAAELIVRLRDDEARLTVIKGAVEAWSRAAPEAVRRFGAGAELRLALAGGALKTASLSPESLERRQGWRDGLLILDGETLAEAAREFNHYNDRKIEVVGAPAGLRVVGAFRNTDPDAFAGAMHDLFGVSVRRAAGRIVIAGGGAPGAALS